MNRIGAWVMGAAALTTTGCAGPRDEPFQDAEFDFILNLVPPPPCGCGEYVARFGGTIHYDEERNLWLDKDGIEVDLSRRAATERPDYPGSTQVRLDASLSYKAISRAFAQLGDAGICRFGRIALPEYEDSLDQADTGEIVWHTDLHAYRNREGQQMTCHDDSAPRAAKPGYSRNSNIFDGW